MTQYKPFRAVAFTAPLALIAGLAFVGAAVPAQARTTPTAETLADWQRIVEKQINQNMRSPEDLFDGDLRIVRVGFDVDAAGIVTGSHLVKSSGLASADREAARVARKIAYPHLPVLMQGKPVAVEMELFFGTTSTADAAVKAAANRSAQTSATIARLESTVRQAERAKPLPAGRGDRAAAGTSTPVCRRRPALIIVPME
ncbi:hypothetical protein BH10PSE13_BH10PSE13_24610 [soil metagenome]